MIYSTTLISHIQKTYGVKAGFVTLNLPKLSEYFCKLGIVDSVVQAPVNKIGFQMNPNLSSNIDTINNFKGNIIDKNDNVDENDQNENEI